MDGKKIWEQMKPAITGIVLQGALLVLNELVKVVSQEINHRTPKTANTYELHKSTDPNSSGTWVDPKSFTVTS